MFSSLPTIFKNRQIPLKGQQLVGEVIAHHPDIPGMIRVRLRDIHDKWPEDCIPWSREKGGRGTGNNQSGSKGATPPIGAKVYGEFQSDNQYHPVYSAGPPSDDKKVEGVNDDHEVYGYKDHAGHTDVTKTAEGKESRVIGHVKGTQYGTDENGAFNLNSADAINQIAKQVMTQVTGMMQMEGQDGHFKFGKKFILEADEVEFRYKNATISKPMLPGAKSPEAPTAPTLPKAGERPKFASVGDSVGGENNA